MSEETETQKADVELDFTRTAAALDAYDLAADLFKVELNAEPMQSQAEFLAGEARIEKMGEAVGEAFGFDTQDRNSVETCRQCIRPGPKVPGPGYELSFVRKTVAKWRQRTGKE